MFMNKLIYTYRVETCTFKVRLHKILFKVGWVIVFYVPSTARSFRDCTPHLLYLAKNMKLGFYTVLTENRTRAIAWQSITLPMCHTSSTDFKVGGQHCKIVNSLAACIWTL